MKHIAAILTIVLVAITVAEGKPLKVFILAGQSNMEGPANISTFDWNRGASNAGYHYLGCAKTFALIGKNLADVNLKIMRKP